RSRRPSPSGRISVRWLVLVLGAVILAAMVVGQTYAPSVSTAPQPLDYVCPMDPDVRSAGPGKCSRCGMSLVLGVPESIEYPLALTLTPRVAKPGDRVGLTFQIRDPKKGLPVTRFETVHEKLFHMFIVSQDLEYFLHDHPVLANPGTFRYDGVLPKPGM